MSRRFVLFVGLWGTLLTLLAACAQSRPADTAGAASALEITAPTLVMFYTDN